MITINLLPRKKPFFTASHIVLAGVGLVWVAGAAALGLSYYSVSGSVSELKQEIKMKETAIAAMQKKTATVQHEDSLEQYLLLSERMQHLFLPPTLLFDEIARNLPAHGRMESIKYNLSGSLELEGSFEQYDDIAAFLHHLQDSSYVRKAEIRSIKQSPIKWQGPTDEQGEPMSAALRTVGGDMLPRYQATFAVQAITVDLKELAAQEKPAAETEQDKEKK
ncbi:PilN domain-containing protein [Brevibacillus sp. GCM10020057]|uniref:PilN domain-containing protein n=1 Tax=Brevibacillus sp. GCM10020057 TaxID=3317327 RepID=UPI00362AD39C